MLKIHFIGIGGIGISGLARFMQCKGHEISGSDIKQTHLTDKLANEGMHISIPHQESAIKDQELVIHSAAVKPDNIERKTADRMGIKTLCRKEALPMILGDKTVYSVCGAHGKSTTTAILASLLEECHTIIGAESKAIGSNMRCVEGSNCVVFEADESDGSFLQSNPYCAIVTNAEPEHMENYNHDLKQFYGAYEAFLTKAKRRIINTEDEFLSSLNIDAERLCPGKDITNIRSVLIDDEPHTRFTFKNYGEFDVWGFGLHIAVDAALAIMAAMERLDLPTIKQRLLNYRGIKKRFDIIQKDGAIVIDDYAHHPTEIQATLDSIKQYAHLKGINNIITIWQPHKYSRTLANLERFRSCFDGTARLIILPVWAAGEEPVDIDFAKNFDQYELTLADRIKKENDNLHILKNDEVVECLSNGLIVGFGAGDITYQLRGAC